MATKKKIETADTYLHMRLTVRTKAKLARLAKKEKISMSKLVCRLIDAA